MKNLPTTALLCYLNEKEANFSSAITQACEYIPKIIRNFNRAPDIGNYEKVINTSEINNSPLF
jgi:hypothetical protein